MTVCPDGWSPPHRRCLGAAVGNRIRLTGQLARPTSCLAGTEFPADTRITGYISTANRDEANFPRPEEIDFHRPSNRRHMTLGLGAHRCLGSHLARMELAIVYEEWHKRSPHYHVTAGTTPRINWPASMISLESLHLTVGSG